MDLALQISIGLVAGILGSFAIWFCPPPIANAVQKILVVLSTPFILLSNPFLRWLGIVDKD
ncbi:MAG: hypothetical protein FI729_02570 [SAR202 cluster bacterium]|nr:hypothetical protein [SAR202 cluster bacterium]|tara:strand:+ start:1924 stop:2106 length:183 start_codon:yes stop_codon:yes gene_type:complete